MCPSPTLKIGDVRMGAAHNVPENAILGVTDLGLALPIQHCLSARQTVFASLVPASIRGTNKGGPRMSSSGKPYG